ncbi:MAG: M48 family metallopeptidase [Verrucomicrobia bacterium]|nr:M48 family metallopeptidase [Verrucomicrobiota bacterium]
MAITVTAVVGGAILLGSLFKLAQLSAGGEVVARDLGGRLIDPSTSDSGERRLLNVVEEMAIAAGIPVPQVWVLDGEDSINAFAAGTKPGNAVVGVTRGCLERLTRAELQGVVAHEFSHILNGDMKLNQRLIGWVFGLIMVSIIGRAILEVLRVVRIGGGSRDKGGGAAVLLAILGVGLTLWLVGLIGTFFGRLIQAAISRQREFLADASAVQFTREPEGLAGALKKIGGLTSKGVVRASKATEARHLFFAESGLFTYGMTTHPPLEARIRMLDPGWDGKFSRATPPHEIADHPTANRPPPLPAGHMAIGMAALDDLGGAAQIRSATGAAVRAGVSPNAITALRSREAAKALLLGLLLSQDERLRRGETAWLTEHCGQEVAARALAWHSQLVNTPAVNKIACLELALPALRKMSADECSAFLAATEQLIASDGEVVLFEFMLRMMLHRYLDDAFGHPAAAGPAITSLSPLAAETSLLLSTFARMTDLDANAAFALAADDFRQHTGQAIELLDPSSCTLDGMSIALKRCSLATPLVRKQLLRMCGLAAARDGVLSDSEAELLRAVAAALGSPLPPFVV